MSDLDAEFVVERQPRVNRPRGNALYIRRVERYDPKLTPNMYGISDFAVTTLLWLRSALRLRQVDFAERLARRANLAIPQQQYAMIELRQAVISRSIADALAALMNDALAVIRKRAPSQAAAFSIDRFTWDMLVTPPLAAGDHSLRDLGMTDIAGEAEADNTPASA